MLFEIVLKAGQKTVPVTEIPLLIACALHPQPSEGRTESYANALNEAEMEHRSALMASVRYGYLRVLSSKTNLPTGENNPLGVVTAEAFINYAAQFNISVRMAELADSRPKA